MTCLERVGSLRREGHAKESGGAALLKFANRWDVRSGAVVVMPFVGGFLSFQEQDGVIRPTRESVSLADASEDAFHAHGLIKGRGLEVAEDKSANADGIVRMCFSDGLPITRVGLSVKGATKSITINGARDDVGNDLLCHDFKVCGCSVILELGDSVRCYNF